MPRPAFFLTDDQARTLAQRVDALQGTYPLDPRNHRLFVRAFMRAVHEATGQLYSPAIYQRLLAAFAPGRRPSTATLAVEKQVLAVALGQAVATTPQNLPPPGAPAAGPAPDTTQLQRAVTDAIEAGMARFARTPGGNGGQLEFYAARLRETEHTLLEVRAEAARLASDLALALQSAERHAQETERVTAMLRQQADAVTKLSDEVTDIRKFALQSIDQARGEARVWKERSVVLEAQRQLDARLLETFRQHAYRAGASIPDILQQDKSR